MRKWTQQIKLKLVERIHKKIIEAFRKEVDQANPSAPPFTAPLNEEQRAIVDKRTDEQFNKDLIDEYDEVIKKAVFLIKLSLPQAFR